MKGYVLATKFLVERHMLVGYMYREKAYGDDSGWRFFVGTEPDEYLSKPENIGVYDIGTILNIDAAVEPYLNSAPGTEFIRIKGTHKFEMATVPGRQFYNDFGYVFATKMLVDNRRQVMFMYREHGEDGDSGWRFFCGEEDQSYVDDSNNIDVYDIKTILDIDNSIEAYLAAEPGTAYERTDPEEPFRVIKDFRFVPEGETV